MKKKQYNDHTGCNVENNGPKLSPEINKGE